MLHFLKLKSGALQTKKLSAKQLQKSLFFQPLLSFPFSTPHSQENSSVRLKCHTVYILIPIYFYVSAFKIFIFTQTVGEGSTVMHIFGDQNLACTVNYYYCIYMYSLTMCRIFQVENITFFGLLINVCFFRHWRMLFRTLPKKNFVGNPWIIIRPLACMVF